MSRSNRKPTVVSNPSPKRRVISVYCAGIYGSIGQLLAAAYYWLALDQHGQLVLSGGRGAGTGATWSNERASRFALNRALTWLTVNHLTSVEVSTNCPDPGEELADLAAKLSVNIHFVEGSDNLATAQALEILGQLHKETEVA